MPEPRHPRAKYRDPLKDELESRLKQAGYRVYRHGWPDMIAIKDSKLRFITARASEATSALHGPDAAIAQIFGDVLGVDVEIWNPEEPERTQYKPGLRSGVTGGVFFDRRQTLYRDLCTPVRKPRVVGAHPWRRGYQNMRPKKNPDFEEL